MSQVNSTCLELLLDEVVPLSLRTTELLKQKPKDISTQLSNFQIKDEFTGDVTIFNSTYLNSQDVIYRIEQIGFSIGLRICEYLIYSNPTNEILKNLELLNIMKFICRDVWKLIFGKQMDNLRTNHRGTFVLIDNHYNSFKHFDDIIPNANNSKNDDEDEEVILGKYKHYLWLPSGLIRGVLKSFGINSLITPEITNYPVVSFNIQTNV